MDDIEPAGPGPGLMGGMGAFFTGVVRGALLAERLGSTGSRRDLALGPGCPAGHRRGCGRLATGTTRTIRPNASVWAKPGARKSTLDAHEHHGGEQNGQPAAHGLLLQDKGRGTPGRCNRKLVTTGNFIFISGLSRGCDPRHTHSLWRFMKASFARPRIPFGLMTRGPPILSGSGTALPHPLTPWSPA